MIITWQNWKKCDKILLGSTGARGLWLVSKNKSYTQVCFVIRFCLLQRIRTSLTLKQPLAERVFQPLIKFGVSPPPAAPYWLLLLTIM